MTHREYKVEWLLIGLAVLLAIVSMVLDCNVQGNSFFSRSGSLVVLLAVIVEFKISSHVYEDIQRAQFQQEIIKPAIPIKAKRPENRKRVLYAAHILLVTGTIIWGYADLVWP